MSWDQYSETPASNYLTGYFLAGMAPSSVKVAGSDIMADLASRFAAMHTATGTANAQVVTQTRQWASLVNGLELVFLPFAANTGATTLAVDGLTAKNIFVNGAACVGGELKVGVPAWVKYDGTQFNLLIPYLASPNNYWADTGSVNALAIAAPIGAYANGQSFLVKVANTTTNSTPTININSLGAKNLYYPDGTTQILAGALILNNIYRMTYDSSLNAAAGGLIVESPSSISASFTITLIGFAPGNITGTVNYRILPDGKTVWVEIRSSINGTSNATTMTSTGVPTVLASSSNMAVLIPMENNSSGGWGTVDNLSTSTWRFGFNVVGGGGSFAGSNVKGLLATMWNYVLD